MDEQNLMQNQKQKKTPFKQTKKLVDDSLMNKVVDENVQKMINKPQADPTGVEDKDKEFMETVIELIKNGTIDLYRAETLMNKEVYDKLDDKSKGTADINAIPLLGELRQIEMLYRTGNQESYQIQNLIHRVRLTKERIEEECGDVYII